MEAKLKFPISCVDGKNYAVVYDIDVIKIKGRVITLRNRIQEHIPKGWLQTVNYTKNTITLECVRDIEIDLVKGKIVIK